MEKTQKTIAIYSRKSRFTGKGESIGNQVELCRDYIAAVYGEDCARRALIFEDEGFSGGNLRRPGFQQMMQAARHRQFQTVVVYRLDRISRSIGDFAGLIQELGGLSIDFVSIREQFDTSSPMGRAMMYIASVFSQLERETIAERIRDNLRELAKTGRWLGGVTPTGYCSESVKSVTVEGKSKKSCKLQLIPQEAELVRQIYDLYLETDSLTQTEAELLHRHCKTKNGRDFTRFSLKAILQNPVYLMADQEARQYFSHRQAEICSPPEAFDGVRGILAYHRTDQQKGKSTVYLPVNQWIISVGQHPGIIPAKAWIQVQRSLERNQSKAYRKPRTNRALLTGLLWCSCGGRMYPKLTKRLTAEGVPVYTYVCKRKERSKGELCDGRNLRGNELDRAVLTQIQNLEENTACFLDGLKQGERMLLADRKRCGGEIEELRRQQMQLRRKIDTLVDSLADFENSAAAGRIRQRVEELYCQEAGLQERMVKLEEQESSAVSGTEMRSVICRNTLYFRDCVEEMTVEQLRGLLRALVRKVVWDGQRVQVILCGAPDSEAVSGAGGDQKVPEDGIWPGDEMRPEGQFTPWREDSK